MIQLPSRRLALGAVSFLVCGALVSCDRGPDERRPNLLFITIDTLRADYLGVYGHSQPTSPNIDEFARSAVVFDEAFAHSSWTLTSLATMLTSTYAPTHGCAGFHHALHESFTTFPEMLVDAGYRTAAITSHVFVGPRHGLLQGIQEIDDSLVLDIEASHEQISSPRVTQKAITFLESVAARDAAAKNSADEPWMLWLHYFDPHELYRRHAETAAAFPDSSDASLYQGEIAFTDLWLGKVFEALKRLDLDENTIIVLTADHGEEFGDHGSNRHGQSLYREVLRIPLMIRAPGFAPRRVTETVRSVDLLPTINELVSIGTPSYAEGISLVPGMRGEPVRDLPVYAEIRLRDDFIAESIQSNGWKLILDHCGASRRTSKDVDIDAKGNRVRRNMGFSELLFDLRKDPTEQHDVAAANGEVRTKLANLLADERRRARELATSGKFSSADSLHLDDAALKEIEQLGYGGGR
jgi:arylsulfatase A-like enzyme